MKARNFANLLKCGSSYTSFAKVSFFGCDKSFLGTGEYLHKLKRPLFLITLIGHQTRGDLFAAPLIMNPNWGQNRPFLWEIRYSWELAQDVTYLSGSQHIFGGKKLILSLVIETKRKIKQRMEKAWIYKCLQNRTQF